MPSPNTAPALTHEASAMEVLMGQFTFHPLHMQTTWIDPANGFAERVTVAVAIPSGLGANEVEIGLGDGGKSMEIECQLPAPLTTPDLLFRAYVNNESDKNYTKYHPEVVAFEQNLKALRTELGQKRSERISSKAKILLPFPVVETKIDKVIVPFKKSGDTGPPSCMMILARFWKEEEIYDDNINSKHPKVLGE